MRGIRRSADAHAHAAAAAFEKLADPWGQVETKLIVAQIALDRGQSDAARGELIACEAVALVEAEPKQHRHLTMAWLAYHEGRFHDAAASWTRRARPSRRRGARATTRRSSSSASRGWAGRSPRARTPRAELAGFEIPPSGCTASGAGGMAEVFLAKKRGAEGTYKLLVVKRILPAHASSRRFRSDVRRGGAPRDAPQPPQHRPGLRVLGPRRRGPAPFDGARRRLRPRQGHERRAHKGRARSRRRRCLHRRGGGPGLHYAHERKDEGDAPLAIVHRDVSPQNVLVSFDGVVKIADFGIASANLFREEPGVLKGKFGYMSPEQARGERVDRRSDVYALGVVLYELLTLRSPYGKLDGRRAAGGGEAQPRSSRRARSSPTSRRTSRRS
jgi:hypothetical protein